MKLDFTFHFSSLKMGFNMAPEHKCQSEEFPVHVILRGHRAHLVSYSFRASLFIQTHATGIVLGDVSFIPNLVWEDAVPRKELQRTGKSHFLTCSRQFDCTPHALIRLRPLSNAGLYEG